MLACLWNAMLKRYWRFFTKIAELKIPWLMIWNDLPPTGIHW